MLLQTYNSSTALGQAILRTLAYADVFDYGLTAEEIHRYLADVSVSPEEVLHMLQQINVQACASGVYTLPGRAVLAATRERRSREAARLWPYAIFYTRQIAQLPYVRMVAVTGALAMNNVERGADIDYLLITAPGHLWLTRAQVLLLGRIASRHGVTLCPNYLITLRCMTFTDRNLYSAHELVQMVPLAGLEVYAELRQKNIWTEQFLPNASGAPENPFTRSFPRMPVLARPMLETLLRSAPASWLEQWEMERKIHRLSAEQSASAESAFSADVCKGHDRGHQASTYLALEERLRLLEGI